MCVLYVVCDVQVLQALFLPQEPNEKLSYTLIYFFVALYILLPSKCGATYMYALCVFVYVLRIILCVNVCVWQGCQTRLGIRAMA